MKYIVIECDAAPNSSLTEFPVIFPADLTHKIVADWMCRALERQYHSPAKPVAAGFIKHESGKVFGVSESLGLKSRGEADQRLIDRHLPRAAKGKQ